MTQLRILVSHSHKDNAFCEALVSALREAGADVWYDESNLGAGRLRRVIMNELTSRPVFIVVLSKAAMKSEWVKEEGEWAYNLYRRERNRIILPVLAGPIKQSDFNGDWLHFEGFTRVGGTSPLPQQEAIERTLRQLALPALKHLSITARATFSISEEPDVETANAIEPPVPPEAVSLDDAQLATILLARGKALNAQGQDGAALPFLECATQLQPDNVDAWLNLGWALEALGKRKAAITAYERAGDLSPEGKIGALFAKGNLLNNNGRYEEALAAFNELTILAPDWASTWIFKGMVLGNIGVAEDDAGRLQESLDALDHVLELQPDTLNEGVALGLMATALRGLGRDAEADELLKRSRKFKAEAHPALMTATDSDGKD